MELQSRGKQLQQLLCGKRTEKIMAQGHDGRSRRLVLKGEDTPADHLSAAIQRGNEEEFVRILKTEATDLQNCLDSVSWK